MTKTGAMGVTNRLETERSFPDTFLGYLLDFEIFAKRGKTAIFAYRRTGYSLSFFHAAGCPRIPIKCYNGSSWLKTKS